VERYLATAPDPEFDFEDPDDEQPLGFGVTHWLSDDGREPRPERGLPRDGAASEVEEEEGPA
jgi:hypothetical protein